jgi:putative peptide zinc metalloprotease protein
MHDRIAGAISRTSVRLLLALVLVATVAVAGAWAADYVGSSQTPTESASPGPAAATAATTPAPSPQGATDGSDVGFKLNGAGGNNIVKITNKTDNRLIVRGRVDFNRIPADRIAPVNAAIAVASCVGCQTYAVALQINLYQRGASLVAPQNGAVAVNAGCSHCVTVARAVQYSIPVNDLASIPNDVKDLAKALDKELKGIEGVYDTGTFDVYQANARINTVVSEFKTLANGLLDQYKVETAADSPSPSAGASPAIDPNATDTPPESSCPSAATPDPSATPGAASPAPAGCATESPVADSSTPAPASSEPSASPSG